jgi:ABC-type transport system involved in multi-copper enzyme maturation permease subunit
MNVNPIHVGAVLHKELRDYRRNRFIVVTMAVLPCVFLALPIINIFSIPASVSSSTLDTRLGLSLLYMLLIPVLVPSAVASYSVVGEREHGTLEPLLTTPVTREELLLGKAAAAMIPSVAISYAAFGVFLGSVRLFAHATVSTAVFSQGAVLLAQVVFTPLLAGWAVWAGIAISTRSSDVRVAQQLSMLASIPPLALTALMSLQVIHPTLAVAVAVGGALLAVDLLAWRAVAALFDRERLITGAKPSTGDRQARPVTGVETNHPKGRDLIMSATLRLVREGTGVELRRGPFEIELDGTSVASIKRHETVATPLESGHHTLRMRSGRYSSHALPLEVDDGEVVNLRCHGAMLWPRYVASIVKPDLAISLKRE